jgi:ABC-type Zn2+ transport system substrate-binding protein/surface adhesin
MKFAFMTLALSGLLALTLNSSTAEAQSLAFLGRELDSKNERKSGNEKKHEDNDDNDDEDDDHEDDDHDDDDHDDDNDNDHGNY